MHVKAYDRAPGIHISPNLKSTYPDAVGPIADQVDDWTERYAEVDYDVFERDPVGAVNRRPGTADLLDRLLPHRRP